MKSHRSSSLHEPISAVQLVNSLDTRDGGPARNAFELNLALNGLEDCDVTLFWLHGQLAETVVATHRSDVRPLPQPGPRQATFRRPSKSQRQVSIREVGRAIRDAEIVIIHGYFLPWVPVAVLWARIHSSRIYVMPHGALTSRQQKYSTAKKRGFELAAGWWVRRWINKFVTGSAQEKKELEQKFPRSEVSAAGVGTATPPNPALQRELHSPVRLLSLSRLAEKKRLDISISAVKELIARGTSVSLTIAGSGDNSLESELRRLSQDLAVGESVRFIGHVEGESKERVYEEADIFVLPSEDENFGIGVAEAAARGLPVAASGEVAAAVALAGHGAVLMRDRTAKSLADAIEEIVRQGYSQQSEAIRKRAEDEFSWHSVAEKWREIVTSA